MEYKIHCHANDKKLHTALLPLIEQHLVQLDRILAKFPVRSLLVSAEHLNHTSFRVKLSLFLDNNSLVVKEESSYLESAVSLGFRKLQRQIRIFKEKMRRSFTFERVREKKQSRPNQQEILDLAKELEKKVAERDFLGFRNNLETILPKLHKFVRRELRFYENGEVLSDRIEMADDIVEESVLDTFEKFRDRPLDLDPEKWIFRHAMELVAQYVQNAREEILENEWSEQKGLERVSHRESFEQEDQEQEEIIQELEEFPLEAVDFDHLASTPNTGGDSTRRKQQITRALQSLPENQRRALVLCFLEGFRPMEAASALNCSEKHLRYLVNDGANRLRQALQQSSQI